MSEYTGGKSTSSSSRSADNTDALSFGAHEYEIDQVLQAFEQFAYQVEYLLELVTTAQRRMNQIRVDKALAAELKNAKELVTLNAAEEQLRQRLDKTLELLRYATNKVTLAEARELFVDLEVRLTEARKQFEQWRRLRSIYETAATLDMFALAATGGDPGQVTQEQAEQAVLQSQIEYRTQVTLLLELVKSCKGFELV